MYPEPTPKDPNGHGSGYVVACPRTFSGVQTLVNRKTVLELSPRTLEVATVETLPPELEQIVRGLSVVRAK
jgi:hypothetical protein